MKNLGRRLGRVIAVGWLIAMGFASPAGAAAYLVEYQSSFGYTVSFSVEEGFVPTSYDSYGFRIGDRPGSYIGPYAASGPFEIINIGFRTPQPRSAASGGLRVTVHDPVAGDFIGDILYGPGLFEGPTSAPTLRLGEFWLAQHDLGIFDVRVRISRLESAVPEPSVWMLWLVGVGTVGAALRARRSRALRRDALRFNTPDAGNGRARPLEARWATGQARHRPRRQCAAYERLTLAEIVVRHAAHHSGFLVKGASMRLGIDNMGIDGGHASRPWRQWVTLLAVIFTLLLPASARAAATFSFQGTGNASTGYDGLFEGVLSYDNAGNVSFDLTSSYFLGAHGFSIDAVSRSATAFSLTASTGSTSLWIDVSRASTGDAYGGTFVWVNEEGAYVVGNLGGSFGDIASPDYALAWNATAFDPFASDVTPFPGLLTYAPGGSAVLNIMDGHYLGTYLYGAPQIERTATTFSFEAEGTEPGAAYTHLYLSLERSSVGGPLSGNYVFVGDLGEWTGGPITADFLAVVAVPEPGTWLMMLGGVGIIGGAMRRQRRIAARLALA